MTEAIPSGATVLVTGSTGYIGGRLIPRLLAAGCRVRCLARDASRLQGRPWLPEVEVAVGDVLQADSLPAAMRGVAVAYYLVHSMGAGGDFRERDLVAARNFSQAAKQAGVERIVYLGGLGDPGKALSAHLRSRQQTGEALCESGVPVTEFRAGVIVGSGSLSFEIIRSLTERVPVMICPRWVYTRIQPIAIRNVLDYLVETLRVPESAGRVIEIGGADVITYGEMLTCYAEVRGLKRWLVPVPVLTPKLSSYWLHLVTPVPASIAKPLIEGLRNETIVRDDLARRLFPSIRLLDYRTAVKLALEKLRADEVETAWSDALSTSQADVTPLKLIARQGMIVEERRVAVAASAKALFGAFTSLGGARGWLYLSWAWHVRGALDRLVGGVGMRRGRRDAATLRVGEALDFWRVEALEPDRMLRLRAEMKVPGEAWLQFQIDGQDGNGRQIFVQTAIFAPKGLLGLLYWYALSPIHGLIFSGMIRKVAALAEEMEE